MAAAAAPLSLKQLAGQLHQLRLKVEQRTTSRRQTRSAPPANKKTDDLISIPLSAPVQQLLAISLKAMQADQQRLFGTPAPTNPAAGAPGVSGASPAPAAPVAEAVPNAESFGPALRSLAQQLLQVQDFLPRTRVSVSPHPNAQPAILAFMQEELAWLSDTTQSRPATPAALLVKLRQAALAYEEGRTTDAITLLKNILNGDPHNHTIQACLSQILYALAANGTLTALPEAREYAQRSIVATEKQRPARLEVYQYLAVVTERAFGEERALEWLRSSGMLHANLLQTQHGLLAARGAYLRAWAVLGSINPALWGEPELAAIHDLVLQVVGGAALYVHWLRQPLLQKMMASKVPDPLALATENHITESWQAYTELSQHWQHFPISNLANPWLLKIRYLQTLAQLLPSPAYDLILCHVALDAQTWRDGVYPEREAQELLEDRSVAYWRLWAQTLSVKNDQRKSALFPVAETLEDTEDLAAADNLLGQLRGLELQYIKPEAWEDLKPWLTRWQTEHLLAAATGSNQPRSRFAPNSLPFSNFYRRWQEPQIMGHQPTEIIATLAKRGAFANWPEALAAMDGAVRLLEDPVHGLVANQKRAFELAKKNNPQKFASKNYTFGKPSQASLVYSMVPLGVMGAIFAAFMFSDNISQAVGISLALVGLGGVALLNLAKS